VAGRRIAQERPVEPALAVVAAMPPAPPPPPEHVPPLPEPDPLPDPGARVPLVAVGRIRIPKIGLDQTVREGMEQMVIDAGPAHWPGTAAFGGWGTTVLAGHRSTHSEPFRRVAELVAGDQIALADLVGTYTYRVTGTEVVANTALWVVDQQPGRHLMIFTCHPIGSSAQRFVVRAELVSTPRPEQ
jgi:sortase A